MKHKNKFLLGFFLLRMNFKTILLFELIYKLVGAAVFTPLLIGLLNLSLRCARLTYVSNDNMIHFLTRPSTIGILLIILVFLTLFTLVEMTSVIWCFHSSWYNKVIAKSYANSYKNLYLSWRRSSSFISFIPTTDTCIKFLTPCIGIQFLDFSKNIRYHIFLNR